MTNKEDDLWQLCLQAATLYNYHPPKKKKENQKFISLFQKTAGLASPRQRKNRLLKDSLELNWRKIFWIWP
jgi:hypothetical protein